MTFLARIVLAAVLLVHGGIHILGFVSALQLAEIDTLTGPTFLAGWLTPDSPALIAFGLLWLIATVTLVGAAIGAATRSNWTRRLLGIGASISLMVTVVWWDDAWIGALVSLVLLIAVVIDWARRRTYTVASAFERKQQKPALR